MSDKLKRDMARQMSASMQRVLDKAMRQPFDHVGFDFGSGDSTAQTYAAPVEEKSLTIQDLQAAAKKLSVVTSYEVTSVAKLSKRLSVMDLGSFVISKIAGGGNSIGGIRVKENIMIPDDVMVAKSYGKIVKVIALTEEASASAAGYARLMERLESYRARMSDRWGGIKANLGP